MHTLRVILQYAVLVGIPFLGVLGVMNLGAKLSPPPSIQGKWILDADIESNKRTPCAQRLSGFQDKAITIFQSGYFLEIRIPNPKRDLLAGRLEGATLLAEAPPALFGDDVFGLLRITGAVEPDGGGRVMRGVIAMPRQVDCVPVPFVARLSPESRRRIE
jgi:hypothetical protein